MRARIIALVFVLLVATVTFSTAQTKAVDSAKPDARRATVEPSETDQLVWQNLRLKAQLGYSEVARLRQAVEKAEEEAKRQAEAADKKLAEIQKTIGADYDPFFEDGKLIFRLKQQDDKKAKP